MKSLQNDAVGNSSFRSTVNEDDWGSVGVKLNILPKSPEDFEYQGKPTGIRENKLITLNATKISIKSAIADDNGKYLYKGTASKFYYWLEDDDAPRSVYLNEGDSWFITKRNGNAYDEVNVDKKHIFVVKRTYRRKKENPWLSICITQIRGLLQKVFQAYYLVVYKVIPSEENKQLSLPRHGNAKHPHAPPYF